MERDSVDRAAQVLWSAWQRGEFMEALPSSLCPTSREEGWAIQRGVAALAGASYGWKIAGTADAQGLLGIPSPLPGPLFERYLFQPGDTLPLGPKTMRLVEAEFAFRLGRDVSQGASEQELADAVSAVHLAVEIPSSRFADYGVVGGPSLLADSACAGTFVLGPELPPDVDLRGCKTQIEINGEIAAEGSADVVMGDPRSALAWLAEELALLGCGLAAGDIVTTGTTTLPPAVGPGDTVRALFGPFGEVQFNFAN